ncbi:MAG: hypothetical protein ACM3XM_18660 [Mycobacterium leprae]
MQRIIVIGSTGSGKTTLAAQLAAKLGLKQIEMDALTWEAGWHPAPIPVFRERVAQAMATDRWVMDGNYGKLRDLTWPAADTVVWLDYSLAVILWRLWWRTLRRVFLRVELWNGNQERFFTAFFTKDSLFYWALQTYKRHKREFVAAFARPEHAHLQVIHLHTPRETARCLASASGSN